MSVSDGKMVNGEWLNRCDDCRKLYPGETYYTFDTEGCTLNDRRHARCTGNMCPSCAGPFMEPDAENDPRKPAVDFYDERIHQSLLDAAHYAKYGDQIPVA